MKTLTPKTAAAWRTWLSRHHASTTEIWLVFFKQHTGVKALTY